MNSNPARLTPAPAAFGTVLLVMSGVLLAADVGITRILRVDEQSPVQRSSIAHAAVQPEQSCAPHHTCSVTGAAREPRSDQQPASRATQSGAVVRAPASTRAAVLERVSTSASLSAPAHIAAPTPAPAAHARLSQTTHVMSAPVAALPEAQTRWGADTARRPVGASLPSPAPLPAPAKLSVSAAEQQSAIRRAKFSVVQMVKAETHGVQWIRASDHAKGRDRLIVRVVAHTNTGTFYEYDVLRSNGIGFAVELRKYRTVLRAQRGRRPSNNGISVRDAGP